MDLEEVKNIDGKKGSPLLPAHIKNYLIDIDGTICEDIPNEEPERMPDAYEIPNAREILNGWYDDGHIITFFTSRGWEHQEMTEKWLKDHGFKYHGIVMGKPRGGNYHWIDNAMVKATRFIDKFTELEPQMKEILVFKE